MENANVGKIGLITGATQGIGRAAAVAIAHTGMRLTLVARDEARGNDVVESVRRETGNADVSVMLADLSSQASVRRLAADFAQKHDRLHLLVNNAGGVFTKRQLTTDGVERTFAVNHLGYFLLTGLLLDLLKKETPSRIVNVSSAGHYRGRIDFDDLQAAKRYSGFGVYCNSKLANVLFTYELARRLEGSGVTANCLHPGLVATGFGKNTPGFLNVMLSLFAPFMKTPEQGARTTIYLATSPEVEGVTGKYFDDSKEKRSSPASYDLATARRLWGVSEAMTGMAGVNAGAAG